MQVNYPGLKKEYTKIKQSYANRGMDLENLLNETNQYYLEKDIAVIYKKPTPIGINKVRYENNKQVIKEAYFKTQSTLDYNGIYKGYYVDFDAKETTSKTAFPLSNIHEHQLEHIKKIDKHGGIAFLIIKMNSAYYTLGAKKIIAFLESNNRKSIPFAYIEKYGLKIKEGFIPPLDFIKTVDLLIKEMDYEKNK